MALDHDDIKEQIKAILEADSSLYDATGASGKVRQINVEYSDFLPRFSDPLPSIFIKNSIPFERVQKIGTKTRGSESNTALLSNFRYDIVIATEGKGARDTINKLDDFQKLVIEAIDADHKLKNGGALKVHDCTYESSKNFNDAVNNKKIQGRIVTFVCKMVT